jgi:hypothetical protein
MNNFHLLIIWAIIIKKLFHDLWQELLLLKCSLWRTHDHDKNM